MKTKLFYFFRPGRRSKFLFPKSTRSWRHQAKLREQPSGGVEVGRDATTRRRRRWSRLCLRWCSQWQRQGQRLQSSRREAQSLRLKFRHGNPFSGLSCCPRSTRQKKRLLIFRHMSQARYCPALFAATLCSFFFHVLLFFL